MRRKRGPRRRRRWPAFRRISGTKTGVTVSAAGAISGTSNSPAITEFPVNGATDGNDGVADALADALALCTAPPDTSFTTTVPDPTNDTTGDFVFASTVPGSTFECRVDGRPLCGLQRALQHGCASGGQSHHRRTCRRSGRLSRPQPRHLYLADRPDGSEHQHRDERARSHERSDRGLRVRLGRRGRDLRMSGGTARRMPSARRPSAQPRWPTALTRSTCAPSMPSAMPTRRLRPTLGPST